MHLLKREKKLMAGCVIFIGMCCLYALWIKPLAARLKTLERVVPEKAALFDQLLLKHQQLIDLNENLIQINQNLADQPQDFDLLPVLEKIALQNQLSINNVQSNTSDIYTPMDQTYAETLITLEMCDITLEQLVGFLTKIPTENTFIRVKNLDIKAIPDSKLLESNMIISHLRLKSNPL